MNKIVLDVSQVIRCASHPQVSFSEEVQVQVLRNEHEDSHVELAPFHKERSLDVLLDHKLLDIRFIWLRNDWGFLFWLRCFVLRLQHLLRFRLKVFYTGLFYDLSDLLHRVHNMDAFAAVKTSWLKNPDIVSIIVTFRHNKGLLEF